MAVFADTMIKIPGSPTASIHSPSELLPWAFTEYVEIINGRQGVNSITERNTQGFPKYKAVFTKSLSRVRELRETAQGTSGLRRTGKDASEASQAFAKYQALTFQRLGIRQQGGKWSPSARKARTRLESKDNSAGSQEIGNQTLQQKKISHDSKSWQQHVKNV